MDNNKDQNNMKASKELSGEEKLLHLMDNGKEEKVTAEEKLLHVIENEHKNSEVKENETKKNGSEQENVILSEESKDKRPVQKKKISQIFSNLHIPKINPGNFDIRKPSLAFINKILIVVAVILTIFFAFYIINERKMIIKRFNDLKSIHIEKNSMSLSLDKPQQPKIDDYAMASQKNNPFHLLPVSEKKDISEIIEKPLDLKLVGILWADDAQAIIEDLNSEKTFIVNEGDPVGEYTVLQITQTQIVLDLDGQKKILK